MSIRIWYVYLLILGTFIGLVGCAEKTVTKENLEPLTENNRQNVDEKEKEKTVILNILEPNTKEVLRTFLPVNMGFGLDDEAYEQEVKKLVRDLARGTDTVPGYDKRMILDKVDNNGQVIKGSPMTVLDESELVEKIMKASVNGGNVELPLYVIASGYKAGDEATLHEELLASYTTYFNSSVAGRKKNIELSAESINNIIVGNEDYFSFNTTVGKRTVENGYQPAPEALNGELVMGIGGGICQTSSTLFNAVDQLQVEYVEKHHHSVTVGYVPEGRDATVSDGGLDFRFQNTTGVPFLIKTVVTGGAITVEVRTSTEYASILKKSI